MSIKHMGATTITRVEKGIHHLSRFAKLERNIAFLCLLIPTWLIMADNGNVRGSISAYYNMTNAHVFYVPLTVAAMMFVVNGLVKEKSTYNTFLGAALLGVVLFNHDNHLILHFISAAAFFLGNAFVILAFSSKQERWFKISLVVIIAASLAAWLFNYISLFWAEWASLTIIALHYMLEASDRLENR